jgi:hypothetical protein
VKRNAKGNKKGTKCHPQWVTVTTSCDEGNNDKEVDDSDEEHVATTERDFKRHVLLPADHFKKLLEATCPHHAYHKEEAVTSMYG